MVNVAYLSFFYVFLRQEKRRWDNAKSNIFKAWTLWFITRIKNKICENFRHLTQDNVSDDLGITGENKRKTLTRYEKGDREPSKSRLKELSNILLVNENLIKQYEFKGISDILYFLLWLEEMFPKMRIDLGTDNKTINLFFDEWNIMRDKKQKMIINYEEYFEWKINYKVEEDSDEWNNKN